MTIPPSESDPKGCIPLSPCAVLHVSGEDRIRFLNGQVTNDVRKVGHGTCLYTAVLNAKGQLDAVCHIYQGKDAFLVVAPWTLREGLLARLDRYLIADDVTLTDLSESWYLAHLLGTDPESAGLSLPEGTISAPSSRFGVPGWDLLSPTPLMVPQSLTLSPEQVEACRISHGIPAWPGELSAGLLPPEAGLDQTAISYDKGCYLGQEVISRMKRAGKTNRHLVLLSVPAATTPSSMTHEDQVAGEITSVSPLEEQGSATALGFRSRKFEGIQQFTISAEQGTARVIKRLS